VNSDPHNDRAKSFVLAVLNGLEASCLKCGVPEAVGFHRCQDLRSNGIPLGIERHLEDTVGSLGGNLEKIDSRRGDGEGVGLEIGMVHELGRVAGNAVVPEVHLILGDQVGGDDDVSVRVVAELREEGLGIAEGGRGGRDRIVGWYIL
jgi:hypothetical protein